jgi:hypothetical protein
MFKYLRKIKFILFLLREGNKKATLSSEKKEEQKSKVEKVKPKI